jgi:hypothetical protein
MSIKKSDALCLGKHLHLLYGKLNLSHILNNGTARLYVIQNRLTEGSFDYSLLAYSLGNCNNFVKQKISVLNETK